MNDIETFIQQKLPADISQAFVDDLRRRGRLVTLKKDETIVQEHVQERWIHYILRGSCVRYIANPKYEVRAVMFHTESFMPMVGNIYIESSGSVVTYNLKANEETLLLKLDSAFGYEWLKKDAIFARFIYQNAIHYLSVVNQFQNHLLGLSSEELLKWLLANHRDLFQRFRSKDIANFMGVTPIWLSNLKRKIVKG